MVLVVVFNVSLSVRSSHSCIDCFELVKLIIEQSVIDGAHGLEFLGDVCKTVCLMLSDCCL